ncbi:rCG52349 [Rattus norvegicus]|uniref:RCG52349 n=1 Tax=Rattus norvegicus TaxID=10116 RepID=A6K0F2_RAT|nr:rCG52349 [Rattus norvegicus]
MLKGRKGGGGQGSEAKGIVPPPPYSAPGLFSPEMKPDAPSEMQPCLRVKQDQPEHKGYKVRVLTMHPYQGLNMNIASLS